MLLHAIELPTGPLDGLFISFGQRLAELLGQITLQYGKWVGRLIPTRGKGRAMATYRQIQEQVKAVAGYVPKTCWIADVKAQHRLTERQAPNRQSPTIRAYPCPPDKRSSIEAAMRHFGMII
jgi:hypothetical protein